jgi:hypothetical protein
MSIKASARDGRNYAKKQKRKEISVLYLAKHEKKLMEYLRHHPSISLAHLIVHFSGLNRFQASRKLDFTCTCQRA